VPSACPYIPEGNLEVRVLLGVRYRPILELQGSGSEFKDKGALDKDLLMLVEADITTLNVLNVRCQIWANMA
jgi:hypothetical protein